MNGRDATPREHKATAPKSVGCFVLTVSDTKNPETDTSGTVIRELLTAAGHRVAGSAIVRDEPAVEALLDKRLPGFGELFRMLSFQEIGAAAMLSRAQMGIHARRIVVSLPGSPNACRLALEKLVIPELSHLIREVSR